MKPTRLRDLVLDVMHARARVVIVGVHSHGIRHEWTRPCWRFMRWAKAHQRLLPEDVRACLRGYYADRS